MFNTGYFLDPWRYHFTTWCSLSEIRDLFWRLPTFWTCKVSILFCPIQCQYQRVPWHWRCKEPIVLYSILKCIFANLVNSQKRKREKLFCSEWVWEWSGVSIGSQKVVLMITEFGGNIAFIMKYRACSALLVLLFVQAQ